MKVTLTRVRGAQFRADNGQGSTLLLDGPPSVGGVGEGFRPMEALLAALAGCSAVDVLMILQKQRQPLDGLRVEVEGARKDATPAVFERISVRFVATGDVDPRKLARAVALSMEKYCSVSKMLEPDVEIRHESAVENQAA